MQCEGSGLWLFSFGVRVECLGLRGQCVWICVGWGRNASQFLGLPLLLLILLLQFLMLLLTSSSFCSSSCS